ncbi:MAG: ATP-binding protein [Chloroflexi bacterium]|nr:ATP-binding protein [Chloroflexota bacterium]
MASTPAPKRSISTSTRGRARIQIADDGLGISAEEIETAFLRHATSKLHAAADLNAIRTLGFRGEALAAISAVSKVTIVSRTAGETAGTRLELEGGQTGQPGQRGARRRARLSRWKSCFITCPPVSSFSKASARKSGSLMSSPAATPWLTRIFVSG